MRRSGVMGLDICSSDVCAFDNTRLGGNEYAMLVLLSFGPLSFIPPLHLSVAEKLTQYGLMSRHGECWYATVTGLSLIGRTLH